MCSHSSLRMRTAMAGAMISVNMMDAAIHPTSPIDKYHMIALLRNQQGQRAFVVQHLRKIS